MSSVKKEKNIDPMMITELMKAISLQVKCLEQNCKRQKKSFEKKKKPYMDDMLKIMSDKTISMKTKSDKLKEIKNKIDKFKETQNLSICKLQKCHKEFVDIIRLGFNSPPLSLAKDDNNSPYYTYYHKYIHLLNKKEILYDDIKDMDRDFLNAASKTHNKNSQ